MNPIMLTKLHHELVNWENKYSGLQQIFIWTMKVSDKEVQQLGWNVQYKKNSSQQWQRIKFGISINSLWWSQLALAVVNYLIFFSCQNSSSVGQFFCKKYLLAIIYI